MTNLTIRTGDKGPLKEDKDIAPGSMILEEDPLSYHIGSSNYSEHAIQPWNIWLEYDLNPWDADIIKRILRTKREVGMTVAESRKSDYEKIIHCCKERIRQIDSGVRVRKIKRQDKDKPII